MILKNYKTFFYLKHFDLKCLKAVIMDATTLNVFFFLVYATFLMVVPLDTVYDTAINGLNFQKPLHQSLVSHDPSESILIC